MIYLSTRAHHSMIAGIAGIFKMNSSDCPPEPEALSEIAVAVKHGFAEVLLNFSHSLYPLAFGLPATLPWRSDRLNDVCLNFFVFCLFCVVVLGPLLHSHFGVILVSFCWHFCVILVSLGVFWRPWASQAARDSNRVANPGSLDAFRPPKGVPLECNFRHLLWFSKLFQVIEKARRKEAWAGGKIADEGDRNWREATKADLKNGILKILEIGEFEQISSTVNKRF